MDENTLNLIRQDIRNTSDTQVPSLERHFLLHTSDFLQLGSYTQNVK